MKLLLPAGKTDHSVYVFIPDTSAGDGSGLTGLVYNSSGLVCYYVKPGAAAAALTLATQTVTGAHSDGGFVEVDSTNMPGVYRLDLSDTILSALGSVVVMLKGATNMAPVPIEIQLVDFDPEAFNVYQAKVDVIDDEGNTADRYTVVFLKNSQPINSGITSPTINVKKIADDTNLVASTALTQIGSSGYYRHDETTGANRMADGAGYYAIVSATIDGASRTWIQPVGRDSAA